MNKLAVVVGVGDGMGFALAKKFHSEGYTVAMIARNVDKLTGYVAQLGERAFAFSADASDETSLKAAFAAIEQQLGAPEVLIYNAARGSMVIPSALSVERLLSEFSVNVVGALVSAQAVIAGMRAAGKGTILFTGGGLSLYPSPQFSSLAIGKAGIRNLAYSLGSELAADNIRVATVTIAGGVQPGTFFDPDTIAAKYWELHLQPAATGDREFVFRQG